ncbi:MAG: protein kinase [Deltaproteobacteria bacterium]|nr:protein kinase [Deltaproteobacteria bacterium]
MRPLRVGGMGAVYVAEQLSTGASRALKLMQRELVTDPSLRERFGQEARVGASIDSDHVVHVVGAGVDAASGAPWIAMELLRGVPLDVYLAARGARPAGEVRYLFEQLCHALGAAHEKGIVHRDLKPPNVFLCTPRVAGLSYVVKVLDFGIAKVLAEAKTTKTAAVGTPLYMAPEQYEAGHVTPATDVWALGLIAFELLTGRSYWKAAASGAATPASIMYETCLGELSPASGRVRDLGLGTALPDGFDAWFGRCVQRAPEARFADARAALHALAEVLGPPAPPHEPLPEPPPVSGDEGAHGLVAPTAPMNDTPATRPLETEVARTELVDVEPARAERRRVSPAGIWGAAGALVGASLLAGLVWMLPKSTPTDASEAAPPAPASAAPAPSPSAPKAKPVSAHFVTGTTARLDGRLLHRRLPAGVRSETYLMLEVRGADRAPTSPTPVNLSLVIDRSGSMKGKRLQSAIVGATQAIERLRDGDRVSVVAFDQTAQTIVPTVKLDPVTRADAIAKVQKLGLGGNTCISCGIDLARTSLGEASDLARRILLLSDGEANVGVRDVPGFERLARAAQLDDVSITTIGVGDDYDPRALTALARESNGQHSYAASEAAMPAIFDAHAKAFASVVALSSEATIRLSPGVEVITVFDRAHRVEGDTVHVPLGQIVRDERKTILLKLAVSPRADAEQPIANVALSYRDLLGEGKGQAEGALAVAVGAGDPGLDAVVEARVARSETAAALLKATHLFEQGKTKEAEDVLAARIAAIDALRARWSTRSDVPPDQTADLDAQRKSLETARGSYKLAVTVAKAAAVAGQPAPAPAAAKPAKMQSKASAADAYKMGY